MKDCVIKAKEGDSFKADAGLNNASDNVVKYYEERKAATNSRRIVSLIYLGGKLSADY